jgi:membrane fusion protein, multidrug efflux system
MNHRSAAALGLSVAVFALMVGCARKPPEPAKTPPAIVVVDRPVVQKVTDYEDFAGRTEPYTMVVIKSRVTGHLKRVGFKDGQDVKKGDPLFEIDNRLYKAEFDRATGALAKAEATKVTKTAVYERVKGDYDKGVAGKGEYDIATGEKDEAAADVRSAKAALETAETNLKFCTITAPFDGRLSKRMVDEENLVKADETVLTTIVQLDEMYATFDIDERTVIRVRKLIGTGAVTSSRVQPLVAKIGLADEDGYSLEGTVTFVDNQFDAGTGTLRLRATIKNPKSDRAPYYFLSPGMFVRVRVPIGNPHDALLVPEKAIGSDQGQKFVFVVNAQNTVGRKNVRVGQQYGQLRVIENEPEAPEDQRVTAADTVIVDGLLRVRPGAEVNPKPVAKPAPKDGKK